MPTIKGDIWSRTPDELSEIVVFSKEALETAYADKDSAMVAAIAEIIKACAELHKA